MGGLIVAALVLAGCGSSGRAAVPTAATRSWASVHAQEVRVMRGAAANAEMVLNESDAVSYCTQLGVDVVPVLAALPAPDGVLNHALKGAAFNYERGAADCAKGWMPTAASRLRAGDAFVRQAVARGDLLGAPLY